ncbi:MAG: aspartate aminotransferase family protein [Sandaracinaceae bacterium]|nr:aspartate aminotransferase family protein [Sandaracinaceae bacterium]
MTSEAKAEVLERTSRYLSPAKVALFHAMGIDIVIGRREGYRIWDIDGRELLDLHLNGGTYNLGHGHPEVVDALRAGLDEGLDIGNHHFASGPRAELASMLSGLAPFEDARVVFSSGGGEAVDVAIKSARRATGRRRVVSVTGAYHGHTGLALATGHERFSKPFLSEGDPADYSRVPFDSLPAIEAELARGDVAAVILETIPATAGFVMPSEGYLAGVRALCDEADALYVADEVQTGLGRTGRLWGVESFGVVPDVVVTAKGLSGGVYPIAATLLGPRAGAWLRTDSHGHVSTFGGAELGCRVAMKVLEITTRESTRENVERTALALERGLGAMAERYPLLREVRQRGLVVGLRFSRDDGGIHVMRALHQLGAWAIVAGFDYGALQVKPGLLWDEATTREALELLERAIADVQRTLGS